jgi:hypothetical protein
MKRTWLVVAVIACASTPVFAAEHLMRINEILRSKNGDTGVQFVELKDLSIGGESFPLGPYQLEVFDAAGVSIGSTSLTITPTPATGRYIATVAADTAFATTHQDLLATVLPEHGQACFEDNANTKIHCLAWGCITHFVVAVGESRTATPPDGMSAQRQGDGTYQIGTPTPDADNVAGTAMVPCATDPLDMPPMPDASVPHDVFDPVDGPMIHDPNTGGGGGCCNVDGRGAGGAMLLAFAALVVLRRRSR